MAKNNVNGNDQGSKPNEDPSLLEAEKAKQEQAQKDAEALLELENAEAEKAENERLEAEKLALDNVPVKSESEVELELLISTIDERKEYNVSAIETKSGFKKDKQYKVSGNIAKELLKKGLVTLI